MPVYAESQDRGSYWRPGVGLGDWTVFGQPVASLSDVANLVVGNYIQMQQYETGGAALADPSLVPGQIAAATAQAMGPNASASDVQTATAAAIAEYNATYAQSIALQSAGDQGAPGVPTDPGILVIVVLVGLVLFFKK